MFGHVLQAKVEAPGFRRASNPGILPYFQGWNVLRSSTGFDILESPYPFKVVNNPPLRDFLTQTIQNILAIDSYWDERFLPSLFSFTSIPIAQLSDYLDFLGIEGFLSLAERQTKGYD